MLTHYCLQIIAFSNVRPRSHLGYNVVSSHALATSSSEVDGFTAGVSAETGSLGALCTIARTSELWSVFCYHNGLLPDYYYWVIHKETWFSQFYRLGNPGDGAGT